MFSGVPQTTTSPPYRTRQTPWASCYTSRFVGLTTASVRTPSFRTSRPLSHVKRIHATLKAGMPMQAEVIIQGGLSQVEKFTYIYIMHRLTLECTISHNTVFKSQPGSTSSACHNHMDLPPSLVAKPCPTRSLGFFVFLQARHGSAGQRPFGQPRAAHHRTIYRPYTQQPRCKDRNVIYHNVAGISTFLSF